MNLKRFKFEKYDYSKFLKRKIHIHYIMTNVEYDVLSRYFSATKEDLIRRFLPYLKRKYINELIGSDSLIYSIHDFNWEWEIMTPVGKYKSNETSN